jgi:hypothetical protein
MSEYTGLLGAVEERRDIANESGCTWEEAAEIQNQRAEQRAALLAQAYNDAIVEIEETNVIRVDFAARRREK